MPALSCEVLALNCYLLDSVHGIIISIPSPHPFEFHQLERRICQVVRLQLQRCNLRQLLHHRFEFHSVEAYKSLVPLCGICRNVKLHLIGWLRIQPNVRLPRVNDPGVSLLVAHLGLVCLIGTWYLVCWFSLLLQRCNCFRIHASAMSAHSAAYRSGVHATLISSLIYPISITYCFGKCQNKNADKLKIFTIICVLRYDMLARIS
jgi:hypothetical protein